jgi:hypothetical protein
VRLFGRLGFGDLPKESALYLAGGSPEEMYNYDMYRSRGFFPNHWVINSTQTGHVQFGGGLNLRGYSGFVPSTDGNSVEYGSSGLAANVELDFNKLIHLPLSRLYLFADGGILGKNKDTSLDVTKGLNWSQPYYDAGIGFATDIKYPFMNQIGIKPPQIRLDFPIYLSQPPLNSNPWGFRWLLALNKSF